MLVNSIDPLPPYKVSDDLVLELVSITAIVEEDPEGAAAAAPLRVEIVEPHTLILHQPPGGYLLGNRQVHMTCAKSAGVRLGDEIKFRVAS
jgi:hypothetical protein